MRALGIALRPTLKRPVWISRLPSPEGSTRRKGLRYAPIALRCDYALAPHTSLCSPRTSQLRPTDRRFKSLNDYLVYYEPDLFADHRRPGRTRGTQVAREIMQLA